jgi:hypothetical protein
MFFSYFFKCRFYIIHTKDWNGITEELGASILEKAGSRTTDGYIAVLHDIKVSA